MLSGGACTEKGGMRSKKKIWGTESKTEGAQKREIQTDRQDQPGEGEGVKLTEAEGDIPLR